MSDLLAYAEEASPVVFEAVFYDRGVVFALLDVAEAAERVAAPGFDIANNADLDAALARLREVTP